MVIRSASDGGALYGSVTTRDVADAATARRASRVDRGRSILNAPIKDLGLHTVIASRSTPRSTRRSASTSPARQEEAELQASGKTIQELAAEAEAAAEFEIAELFDDIGGAAQEE